MITVTKLPIVNSGCVDLSNNSIFVSDSLRGHDVVNTIAHEIGHIVTGSHKHTSKWLRVCETLYPPFSYLSDYGDVNIGNTAWNIGNITGIQQVLTDYVLLQSYRRFSQRVLGTEGHWEFIGDEKIRLYPTPKGSYPVVVVYIPAITRFRSPQARLLANEMLVAEAKCIVGAARGKFSGIPAPDGGQMSLNGDALVQAGAEAKEKIVEKANLLAEPLSIYRW